MPQRFRAVIDLVQRPGQQRRKVSDDSSAEERIAQRGENALRRIFQQKHTLPDHHDHDERKNSVAQEERGHDGPCVAIEDAVGDLRRLLHVSVFFKDELENQCSVHKHGVYVRTADRSGQIGEAETINPLPLRRRAQMQREKLVHPVKAHVIQRRSRCAADDARRHAPDRHIEIGDLHQADRIRALVPPDSGIKKIADDKKQTARSAEQ